LVEAATIPTIIDPVDSQYCPRFTDYTYGTLARFTDTLGGVRIYGFEGKVSSITVKQASSIALSAILLPAV